MKKHYLLSALIASFLILLSLHGADAQTAAQNTASISGDEVCGASAATKCTFADLKKIAQSFLVAIVSIGSIAIVVFGMYRLLMAEVAARQGNPAARMQALRNVLNGFVGVLIIIGILGGFYMLALKMFGVNSWTTGILRLLSDAFVEHAYAANDQYLPNPLAATNIFDLIAAGLNLIIRFFIYPMVVVLWVWAGFQFVYAQGNPEGLKKAKSWLLWSFLITVATFTLQGFVFAIKNTMLKIAPQNAAIIQQQPGAQQPAAQGSGQQVQRDPSAPADGEPGSACTTESGGYGIRGADRSCTSRSSSYANQPVTSCSGQVEGTPCTVSGRSGTCTVDETGSSFGCYVTEGQPVTSCQGRTEGTPCTVAGRVGICTSDEANDAGGVFGCYVLVSSCNGQVEGTPCTVAGRRGTCTVDETGSSFSCYVTTR